MTRVHFTVVGDRAAAYYSKEDELTMVLEAVPREGEIVHLPDVSPFRVRRVAHYPRGNETTPTPFVSVVLGDLDPPHPRYGRQGHPDSGGHTW